MSNTLIELKKSGQSPWIDYLSRDLIQSGKLKQLRDENGLCGVTSNPTIFQEAMSGSGLYDERLKKLLDIGLRKEKDLFVALSLQDIADAADILRPVYDSAHGRDGFISIEVSPDLAYDIEATVEEAVRLFTSLARPNVMIKVPATLPGLEAIERLTAEGVNVNVTLLFSVSRYAEVVEAYLSGIEKRLQDRKSVEGIASVASFFVSRVDVLVDKLLEESLNNQSSEKKKENLKKLRGKAAVANARLAYRKFKELFASDRFIELEKKGARVQRLLWGSTSTKNPEYSDIKYVQELIGKDTVNTMPEDTMMAFRDHGEVKMTIEKDLDSARALFLDLEELGLDMHQVTDQLEKEGVKKFSDSFIKVLAETADKRDRFLAERK
jgi:transaldolase